MRHRLDLYISGVRVDTAEDTNILFNYEGESIETPLAIKNAWSQSISLPRTPVNEGVFSHLSRLDHYVTASSFNPLERVPFVLYNELSEVVQRGYTKVDSIDKNGYSITLYGELGSIFAALTYNEDGSTKTLADLVYTQVDDPEHELDFTINRSNVAQAWGVLSTGVGYDIWKVINFAPCYNGIPADFDAKGCVFMRDNVLCRASLSREFTDIEAHEFRSYLLRPVVSVKAVLEAICRAENNGGYNISIPSSVLNMFHIKYGWMTLPMMKKRTVKGFGTGFSYTKADILGGTMSPKDFLLSLMKILRLFLVVDVSDKSARILPARTYYYPGAIDINDRIDRSAGITQTPVLASTKWYDMVAESESEDSQVYLEKYGKPYGAMHIDTNTKFDVTPVNITEGIKFKAAPMSQETSLAFCSAYEERGGQTSEIPAMFLEGGTYTIKSAGRTDTYDILSGKFSYQWWNDNGRDLRARLQLHAADNKAIAGDGVLLFFGQMEQITANRFRITDDDTSAMGDRPCWNFLNNSSAAGDCIEYPIFSRFEEWDRGRGEWDIVSSWEYGEILESASCYITGMQVPLYDCFHKGVLRDRYDVNTFKVTTKVDLKGMQIGEETLRYFYYFDECYWVLNKINNYSMSLDTPTECEFIKVQNTENYQ